MKIKIEELTGEEIRQKNIKEWPIWQKEISRFDWFYESPEECLLLEGKVTVKSDFETVTFGKGDFVTFPKGLRCVWEITKPVKKHYNFL
jgi:uncharacterized protein